MTRRFVGRAIDRFWGPLTGLRVLGLGYAPPYLSAVKDESERTLAFMPANQGVVNWPRTGASASALVDPLMMPLPDASIDRVLVVHALETVESPSELLHEIWRILTPGGRIILVAPNRRGLWARMDTTPFGYGQPYSRSQLKSLMRQTWFSPGGLGGDPLRAALAQPPPAPERPGLGADRRRLLPALCWAPHRRGDEAALPARCRAGGAPLPAFLPRFRPGSRSPRLADERSSMIPPPFAGVRRAQLDLDTPKRQCPPRSGRATEPRRSFILHRV